MIDKFIKKYLKPVISISNECFSNGWSENLFIEELKNSNRLNYVYLENEKVVGYCFSMINFDRLEILDIAVLKEYRNKNIATELLLNIEEKAKEKNKNIIFSLEVSEKNLPAIALYKKLGYKEIFKRKDYYEKGNSAIIMEKK